jgi:hypothetical protein
MRKRLERCWIGLLCAAFSGLAFAGQSVPVHGLWVWKGPAIISSAHNLQLLREFCDSEGITEIYISVSEHGDLSGLGRFADLIAPLHASHIRVEALLSSENADEPGKHRDKLLDRVRDIVRFNRLHPNQAFDGIHLDIEPQQRPENKGPGNLKFLPGLVDAYRAVQGLTVAAGLSVNADIQNKLLKGDRAERKLLLTSLPRFTLMLYEVSSPTDGDSTEQQAAKIAAAGRKFLELAYDGLSDAQAATMLIALRTPDYGARLPVMLKTLDQVNAANPHYRGWARHSFNDVLPAAE